MKKFSLLKIILKLFLLIIAIKSDNITDPNEKIIKLSEEQGYNIRMPEDKFFNDICQYFSSENNTDVSLEYRRKYYYYPNGKQLVITNNYRLNQVFSEPIRNNIFSCFKNYLTINYLYINITLYFIVIIFLFQFSILMLFLCGKYRSASEKTPEEYINYINKNKKKCLFRKSLLKNKIFINNYIFPSSQNIKTNENNNTQDGFKTLNEENNNSGLNNDNNSYNIDNSKDQNIKNEDRNLKHQKFLSLTIEKINNEENELKKDDLNTTGDFKHGLDEYEDNKNNEDNNKQYSQNTKNNNFNADEIYTFGGLKLDVNNKEESNEKKKIVPDIEKAEKTEYVYNKINNIKKTPMINNNNYFDNMNQGDNILTKEELYYSGYSVVMLQDKRSFKDIYFDILSHCQIIFHFLPNFYIYEDSRLRMIYYTFKLFLYFIVITFLFNDISIINQIYDNKLTFFDYFVKSLIATIIVNLISQLLFFLTNSKRTYIRYTNKLTNSIFGKKRIIKYVLKDIIELINYNLFWKILLMFFFSIIIFIVSSFLSICFCIAYYNTQFIVLKCIVISVMISQICPFFLALIPAKLRKKAIDNKNNKLFICSKIIDSYFLP